MVRFWLIFMLLLIKVHHCITLTKMWNPTQSYSKLPFFIIMRHTSCMQKVYCLIRTYQVSLLSSLHRNDSLKFQCDKILCSLWKCLLWFECYLVKFRGLSKRHIPSRCWLLTPSILGSGHYLRQGSGGIPKIARTKNVPPPQ